MYYGTTLPGLKAELMLRGYDVEGKSDEQIIQIVLENGLPARRNNLNLEQHQTEHKDQDRKLETAFRGTTTEMFSPNGDAGAAIWAGNGGLVVIIDETRSWYVNSHEILGPHQPKKGEQEHSILAHVPSVKIVGVLEVTYKNAVGIGIHSIGYKEFLNPNYKRIK